MEPAVSRTTDILVVGSGMAGLMAAIVASGQGKRVTLLSRGCGSLNIGSGCVDVLGYVNGQPVEGQPLEALDSLPERHPYRLVGKEGVEEALKTLCAVSARHGAPLEAAANGNRRVPTILGTLKPTCLTLPSCRGELLETAASALVVSVEGLKDSHPALVTSQLRRYPHLAAVTWHEAHLENPIPGAHRNLSPLDIARYVERIIVMNHGEKAFDGPPKQVFAHCSRAAGGNADPPSGRGRPASVYGAEKRIAGARRGYGGKRSCHGGRV